MELLGAKVQLLHNRAEGQIKLWSRRKKEERIDSMNPDRKDPGEQVLEGA